MLNDLFEMREKLLRICFSLSLFLSFFLKKQVNLPHITSEAGYYVTEFVTCETCVTC